MRRFARVWLLSSFLVVHLSLACDGRGSRGVVSDVVVRK